MSRTKIWQNEIDRLRGRLRELESFERPRVGTDMTADRIRRIKQRIRWYQNLIASDGENESHSAG